MAIGVFVFIAFGVSLSAQKNEPNPDFIARLRGDTIKQPKILLKTPYPEKDALTIQLRKNRTRVYRPRSIASFFHNNKYYESLLLREGKDGKRNKRIFARKLLGGEVSLYITQDGSIKELYLKKGDERPKLLSWEKYMKTIENSLDNFKNFNAFMETIGKEKTFYDEHAMVNYLSNYNAYNEPEKYVPVELEFFEKTKFNIYTGVFATSVKQIRNDFGPEFNSSLFNLVGYTLGVNLQRQITRSYGINISLALSQQQFSFTLGDGERFRVNFRSVQNPVYVHFEGYLRNTLKYYWEIGGLFNYPTRGIAKDSRGNAVILSNDLAIAPMAGAGVGYRLRDDRQIRVFIRGVAYRQRILDLNPTPGNFIPESYFRFFNLGLFATWEF